MSSVRYKLHLDATWHVHTEAARSHQDDMANNVLLALLVGCIKHNGSSFYFEDNVEEIIAPFLPRNNMELNAESLFAADIVAETSKITIPADISVERYWQDEYPEQRAAAIAQFLNRLSEFAGTMHIDFEWSNPVQTIRALYKKIMDNSPIKKQVNDETFAVDFLWDSMPARVLSGHLDNSYADFDIPEGSGNPLRWKLWACANISYYKEITLLLPQLNSDITHSLINHKIYGDGADLWRYGSKYGIDVAAEFKSRTISYWESLNETVVNR